MQKCGFIALGFLIVVSISAFGDDEKLPVTGSDDAIIIPQFVSDPLEPINRRIWGFNKIVTNHVVHPVGKGYRFIVCKPVREKISNFSENLTFPRRLINNLLQGRWRGARHELHRFVVNTTIGGLGLFDPASALNIPRSETDFGQTFGRWGWDPSMYVVIPFLGPSNERDSLGLLGDTAAHPAIWVTSPYLYGAYGFAFNDVVDQTGEFKRFTEAGTDSYSTARQLSAVLRENDINEFRISSMPDEPAMVSLNAIFFTHQDGGFPEQAKTRSALIPTTGKRLKYSVWMQGGRKGPKAAVVYLLPGLGGHRIDRASLALAELIFSQGYSVVSVSSIFNAEFMESASTAAVPGFSTADNRDIHVALGAIDQDLQSKYGDRLGDRALLGFSMGAFQTMMLAAYCETEDQGVQFERYIAINPPVDLVSSMSVLDGLYELALRWPRDERIERIAGAFRKVGVIIAAGSEGENENSSKALPALPFDHTESGFLIGYSYHTILRDIIYSSQSRNNLGVLKQPIRKLRRAAVYEEIDHYNFSDYLSSFILPYYQNGGKGVEVSGREVRSAANLKNITNSLRRVSDLRIISCVDDFLLKDGDLHWLRSLVPGNHIKVFPQGGHMGQLATKSGQIAVIESIGKL